MRAGIAIADLLAGMFAAHGIELALLERARSGKARWSTRRCSRRWSGALLVRGDVLRDGPSARTRRPAPSALLSVRALHARRRLSQHRGGQRRACGSAGRALGQPSGSGRALRDAAGAAAHRDELTARDRGGAAPPGRRGTGWSGSTRAGVPAGPVLGLEQVFADPQVLARDMLVELPHPEVGAFQHDRSAGQALAHARRDRAATAAARRAHRRGARASAASRQTRSRELRACGAL